MSTYTIIAHTEFADYAYEVEAPYVTDALLDVRGKVLAAGFLYGTFTVEFLTDAEAAEYYAACKAEAA